MLSDDGVEEMVEIGLGGDNKYYACMRHSAVELNGIKYGIF